MQENINIIESLHENGEFKAEDIREFTDEPMIQYQQKEEPHFDLDETIGYINILDEDERAHSDTNKNIPRVQKYQNNQITNVVNFLKYQFPQIIGNPTAIRNNIQKNLDFQGNKSNCQENESQNSEEGKVIMQYVNKLLEYNPNDNQQNGNGDLSPTTKKTLTEIDQAMIINEKEYVYEHPENENHSNGINGKQHHASPTSSIQQQQANNYNQTDEIKQNNIIQSKDIKLNDNQDDQQTQQPSPEITQQNNNTENNNINNNLEPVKKTQQYDQQTIIEIFQQWLASLPQQTSIDEQTIYQYNVPEIQYSTTKQQLNTALQSYKFYPSIKDDKKNDSRAESSYKSGGKRCVNNKVVTILRDTGKNIISQIGNSILTGNFNLTQISFPIKVMIPQSGLEKALRSTCMFPFFMTKATCVQDPIERLKYVICASIGHFYLNLSFFKPLNPILGETCYATYPDGTQLYAEQISHHPPISYFSIYGPENSYKYYGSYNFESNAGLNSMSLKNKGTRAVIFKDGQKIEYNFGKEKYTGSFWGTMRTECEGKVIFKDVKNQLEAKVEFDAVSGKPSDYIKGYIKKGDKKICKIYGTYMGFIEFDDVRYWDHRHTIAYNPHIQYPNLMSDQLFREDKTLLSLGQIVLAQNKKEEMEQLQRQDAALRKQSAKQRQKEQKLNKKKK